MLSFKGTDTLLEKIHFARKFPAKANKEHPSEGEEKKFWEAWFC